MFCPVYLAEVDSDGPIVAPRRYWMWPLYWCAQQIQGLVIGLCSLCFEDYEPRWYFKVTGEL